MHNVTPVARGCKVGIVMRWPLSKPDVADMAGGLFACDPGHAQASNSERGRLASRALCGLWGVQNKGISQGHRGQETRAAPASSHAAWIRPPVTQQPAPKRPSSGKVAHSCRQGQTPGVQTPSGETEPWLGAGICSQNIYMTVQQNLSTTCTTTPPAGSSE